MNLCVLIAVVTVTFLVALLMQQTIVLNQTLGKQNDTNYPSNSNSSKSTSKLQTTDAKINLLNISKTQHDDIPPTVNITFPAYAPTLTTGKIIIQGTASDSRSGISNVSAAADIFPFPRYSRTYLASQPIPMSPNNWSHWSVPLVINKTGTYRVLIEARDNAGNHNYAETIINVPFLEKNDTQIRDTAKTTLHTAPMIAFVRPTFTEAAYQEHGFYDFYSKNRYLPYGKNITTDLDMLTVRTPGSVSNFDPSYAYDITSLIPINGTVRHDFSHYYSPNPQKFWMTFINHIRDVVSDSIVNVIRDEDVHDGHLFYTDRDNLTEAYPDNKTNAYDVLMLLHNEYVTQKEYDNLRQFVKNGGTIVFIDANVFNTEVRYDKDHHTITLVKGHSWEFDGKSARRSIQERWYNETKDWVGSNYLVSDINDRISFTNNPFNYFTNNAFNNTHFEEQFVNNPKAKKIIDYGIKFPPHDPAGPYFKGKNVATYTLEYGKGKSIMLGLSGRFLSTNERFMWFFDNGILPKALCPKFQSCLLDNSQNDITRPSVNITIPAYAPTVTTGKIIIQGTANDLDSGIRNVSAAAHTFPFDGHFRVKLASQPIPISPNNWSHWSLPLVINKTGTYRVLIEARDKAGNPNWAETTINAAIPDKNKTNTHTNSTAKKEMMPKIAFVRPTFTEAAYQEHGFYRFDSKYDYLPYGKNITTDLDMLTRKTPKSVSEFRGNDIRHLSNITSLIPINGTELHNVISSNFPYQQKFWRPFIDHVKKIIPNATITVMRDEDIHDGHIFYQDNKSNAYDILLLFHSEYVTQSEYNNLKQFVKNGGTIVFIDANIFYAEVRYDRNNHTITLVKGHDWKFDGKAASRSVSERWYNETKDWVGSNFLNINTNESVTFANNLFNYTRVEEQLVNNPKAKIIIDYGIKLPKDFVELYLKREELPPELQREDIPIENIKVATYSLDYGQGKVIMLGLYGEKLVKNQSFLLFFDNLITQQALTHSSKQ